MAAPPVVRRALLASLTQVLGAAVEAGDLEAARLVHETMGKLLAAPAPTAAAHREGDVVARRAQ